MEIYARLPSGTGIRHKILLYLQNPETEHLLKHWRKKYFHERRDIIVSLNRYWWFFKNRMGAWDDACRIQDDYKNTVHLFLEFSHENEGYADDMYLEFLEEGWWYPCKEKSYKLRIELFNMLEEEWWKYHGDCSNPWILDGTRYNPIADKVLIESNFDIEVPGDKGHPTASYDEWLKRTICGEVPIHRRRKIRVPRLSNGKWDREMAKKTVPQSKLIRRTWCRWDQTIPEANFLYSFYERR